MNREENTDPFHWFVGSCLHWNVSTCLFKALQQQKKSDTGKDKTYKASACYVYKVPLQIDAHYGIDNYIPDVEGIEFIAKIDWLAVSLEEARTRRIEAKEKAEYLGEVADDFDIDAI